ncbi:MAG: hypothetical protein K0R39_961 [Symbiobacteriaceae bacterium]|jgi:hypothetical protein|nr:hypothetical protein [Symbiobacteriaceae bacterium]
MGGKAVKTTTGSMKVFIPKVGVPEEPVPKDDCYLVIKYAGAQAYFRTGWLTKAEKVVLTSQVDLGLDDVNHVQVPGIEYIEEVRSEETRRLPLERNIFKLVPATMDSIRFQLDFVVDEESQIHKMANLINKGLFSPVLSLASPAADAAVQKVGQIAGELIGAFIGGANKTRHLVHFDGDFNITTGDLKPGYIVMIGSPVNGEGLPAGDEEFTFVDNCLFIDGQPAHEYNWVALEVQTAPARGLRRNSELSRQLDQVRVWAKRLSDRLTKATERRKIYEECMKGLELAELSLVNDPYYIPAEKQLLLDEARSFVESQYFAKAPDVAARRAAPSVQPKVLTTRNGRPADQLIPPGDAEPLAALEARVSEYQKRLKASEGLLRQLEK